MRINEINGIDEGIFDAARRGAQKIRNKFSSQQPATPQDDVEKIEPTMGGTTGPAQGGFLSGFAKGAGAPELAKAIDAKNASDVTQGNFPFPSSVPAADAAMPKTPPPVNEPEPEDEVDDEPVAPTAGANAFGQMTRQLNVMPKTSTGGTLANTPTGITHTASPTNPNQPAPAAQPTTVAPAANTIPNTNFGLRNIPQKQTPNYSRGQTSAAPTSVKYSGMPQTSAQTTPNRATMPVGESIDIAEALWRKMKSKR